MDPWDGRKPRTETWVSEYNPVCCQVKSRMSRPPKNAGSTTPSHPLPRLSLADSAQRIPPAPDRVNIQGREQGLTCKGHQETALRPLGTSTPSAGMNQICCPRWSSIFGSRRPLCDCRQATPRHPSGGAKICHTITGWKAVAVTQNSLA